MNPSHKTCTKCGKNKPLGEFHKCSRSGHVADCKVCRRAQNAMYRKNHPDRKRESEARYRQRNKEKERLRHMDYNARNREEIRSYHREYQQQHSSSLKVKSAKSFLEKQRISQALATVPLGTPWEESEDRFLLEENGMTVYQKSIYLGRTFSVCKNRLYEMKKESNDVSA